MKHCPKCGKWYACKLDQPMCVKCFFKYIMKFKGDRKIKNNNKDVKI